MRARAPIDVDLEDRLIFGLSPQRFGYLALAALAGMAAWKSVPYVGFVVAAIIVGLGAALAWGRWRGLAADRWVVAAAGWAIRNLEIEIDQQQLRHWLRFRRRGRPRLRIIEGVADP